MGIVLSEAADPGQAVKFAALLVAVDSSEFGKTQREITVAAGCGFVNLAMMRTVHGLEHVFLTLLRGFDGLEGVLAVFCPVTGSDIQLLVADMGSYHLKITVFFLYLAEELLKTVAERRAFGQPQRKALTYGRGECEKLHLLSEFAMVTFLRFLKECQILVEHLFLREGDAVDTHKLIPLLIATPVGARKRENLNCLDR